jgi:Trypsin-co-occurring domain 1
MDKVIEQAKDGVSFFIEVSPEPDIVNLQRAGGEQAGFEEDVQKLQDKLEEISSTIAITCTSIQSKLPEQLSKGPRIEELEIEFGIKLSVEAGVILTKAAGEATIKVTAKIKLN